MRGRHSNGLHDRVRDSKGRRFSRIVQKHGRSDRSSSSSMNKIAILLCLVVTSTAQTEPPKAPECKTLHPLRFRPNPTPDVCPQSQSQLGDHRRSPSATSRFFHSLDTDDSGIISRDEMALFLKDRIGGSQFDNSETVNKEVGQVMKQLDLNQDNGLDVADVEGYWQRLESLLTAEEVSEWVVHAIQLPAYVGGIFLENGITAYDFPEIVQNSGLVLLDELGLKSSFRSKIVRGVQARMLGIGSIPEVVRAEFTLSSCRSVRLTWSKSTARIFPVHSYRVQRKAVNLFDSNEINDADSISMMSKLGEVSTTSDSIPTTAWKTIYIGGETELVDSTLEMGHNYMYRIQAWNSVGRSPWEVVELESVLRKKGCSKKSKKRIVDKSNTLAMRGIDYDHDDESWEWLSLPKKLIWGIVFAIQFVYHSARAFFMVIAMGGAIMRFRRASATSSASATAALPFPWFWIGINRICVKLIGHECIPPTMLGDKEAILLQEKLHDERVMATGLRGYARTNETKEEGERNTSREISNSEGNISDDKLDQKAGIADAKHYSTGNLLVLSPELSTPPREIIVSKSATPKSMFKWMKNSRQSDSSGVVSSEIKSATKNDTKSERNTQSTRLPCVQQQSQVEDGSICIVCQKKFKLGKRYRHHCSRCMATFCHKHGKATHSNFTSCKVPGSCLCDPCLKEVVKRSTLSPKKAMSVA